MRGLVLCTAASVALGCVPALRQPVRPWVLIQPAQAYQKCVVKAGHGEFAGKPHVHAAFVFTVEGRAAESGETLLVTVNGADRAYRFEGLDGDRGARRLDFPAGLGTHTVVADWQDKGGRSIASAETVLSVYDCEA